MLSKTFKVRDLEIPVIGLGTHTLRGTRCTQTVNFALSLGYKHIDTSPSYLNEPMLSYSLERVDRNSVFITSKISYGFFLPEKCRYSLLRTLSHLKTSYIDLCLIEWPAPKTETPFITNEYKRLEVWEALVQLKKEGLTKHIGVSNFTVGHLSNLIEQTEYVPEVNQIEFHPLCHDKNMIQLCKEKQVQIVAHTPLAKKSVDLFEILDLKMLARKYKVTVAQIVLNWTISKGMCVIPMSSSYENIRANSNLEFTLAKAEIEMLDSLNKNRHFSKDPTGIK